MMGKGGEAVTIAIILIATLLAIGSAYYYNAERVVYSPQSSSSYGSSSYGSSSYGSSSYGSSSYGSYSQGYAGLSPLRSSSSSGGFVVIGGHDYKGALCNEITGWACNKKDPYRPPEITFTADMTYRGNNGKFQQLGRAVADQPCTDPKVLAYIKSVPSCSGSMNRCYKFAIPASLNDGLAHMIGGGFYDYEYYNNKTGVSMNYKALEVPYGCNQCTDSDATANDPFAVAGGVIGYSGTDGSYVNEKDVCYSDSKSVIEKSCDMGIIKNTEYVCPAGCMAGACLPMCNESDGGLDYGKKGTTVQGNAMRTDLCNGNILTENYCKKDGARILLSNASFNCNYGCSNGACLCGTKEQVCNNDCGISPILVRKDECGVYIKCDCSSGKTCVNGKCTISTVNSTNQTICKAPDYVEVIRCKNNKEGYGYRTTTRKPGFAVPYSYTDFCSYKFGPDYVVDALLGYTYTSPGFDSYTGTFSSDNPTLATKPGMSIAQGESLVWAVQWIDTYKDPIWEDYATNLYRPNLPAGYHAGGLLDFESWAESDNYIKKAGAIPVFDESPMHNGGFANGDGYGWAPIKIVGECVKNGKTDENNNVLMDTIIADIDKSLFPWVTNWNDVKCPLSNYQYEPTTRYWIWAQPPSC